MREGVNKPMEVKATLTVYRDSNGQYGYCFAFPSEQQPQIEAHIAKLERETMFSITELIKPHGSRPDKEGPFDALRRRALEEARRRGLMVSVLESDVGDSD